MQINNNQHRKSIKGGLNPVMVFIFSYIVFPLILLILICGGFYYAYKYFLPDGLPGLPSLPSIPGLEGILGDGSLLNPSNEDPGDFVSAEDIKNKKYNYIFGTVNEKGKKYYYPVPDDGKIWYNPAMGIQTPDIFNSTLITNTQDGLNYDGGENNPHESPKYYGIEFQDNKNSIFKFSPDGDANNSKGLEGENNASVVFNLEAPTGYIPEPSILYREQMLKDYVYRVFRKDSFNPPKPNYIMQTINNNGKINTYVIPDEKMWVLPKKGITNKEVLTLNYNGGTANEGNKKEHYGVEFKKDSEIFVNASNKNNTNSWGCCRGKNNCNAVYALPTPAGYTKETKFLYRNQKGPNYCYSVFKLNSFDESQIDLNPIDTTTYNGNYIFQTVNSDGKIITYNVPDDKIWYAAKKNIKIPGIRTLNYDGGKNRVGNIGAGIEFENDDKTIFAKSSNDNDENAYLNYENSYGNGHNISNTVYALPEPKGYTKEDKYLYRYKTGADFVYVVFKKSEFNESEFNESKIKLDFVDTPGTLLNCPSYGEIKSKNKCLDLPGSKTDNGVLPQIYDCNNSIAQQFYYDTKTSSIRSVSDFNKCLDVPNGDAVINKKVQIYDCNDSKPQKFNYISDKTLFNSALDNNLCLDSSNGSSIILNTCNDSEDQKFKMNRTFNTGLTCTMDSRVADCPPGYTNNGSTCGRGVSSETLDFGKGKYVTVDCPKGTTNTGGSCLGSFGRGAGRDDVFYDGWSTCATEDGGGDRNNCEKNGARVYPKCSYLAKQKGYDSPDNWTNDGCCMCSPSLRDINKVGKCPDPVYKEQSTGLCYVNCAEKYGEGYYNNGSNCRREADTKGLDSMVCNNPGEHVSSGRCYKKQPPNFTNMGTYMSFNR